MNKKVDHLYTKLKIYSESGYYGFHMPGHKRNASLTGVDLPYEIDITEIPGFDDLHHAEGILKEAQERAAKLYHSEETHYLVNGSTVGILSAILGCTRYGDRILTARNCHKSVYNAVILNHLSPVYVYPEKCREMGLNGRISPESVVEMLERYPDIRAVVITSPTYDGVVSDVRAIAEAVHSRGVPLIVDEAHGAHFGFHPYFPENSCSLGADLVIHSLHKTLPALTQTALLHINGELVDRSNVRRYLHMLQSSSPSYVLMAGIDECVELLWESGGEIFERYADLLGRTRRKLKDLENLKLFDEEYCDRSKILISCRNLKRKDGREIKKYTGKDLYEDLKNKYLLQMEMAAPDYVIAMTSPADTEDGMRRLTEALREIDQSLAKCEEDDGKLAEMNLGHGNQQVWTPDEAERIRAESVAGVKSALETGSRKLVSAGWDECAGGVALEYAYVYPPGIPLIVPGERISSDTAKLLAGYEAQGFQIEGTQKHGRIEVIVNG